MFASVKPTWVSSIAPRIITTNNRAPLHIPGLDVSAQGACGSEWFYYQFFFASKEERDGMRKLWEEEGVRSGGWRWGWSWWKDRQQCRLTQVEGMEGVLNGAFGAGWKPPPATIGSLDFD